MRWNFLNTVIAISDHLDESGRTSSEGKKGRMKTENNSRLRMRLLEGRRNNKKKKKEEEKKKRKSEEGKEKKKVKTKKRRKN